MQFGSRIAFGVLLLLCAFACIHSARAATGGSISGTVKDQSDALVPGAALTLVNLDLATSYKAVTDQQGFYSFPTLPVGCSVTPEASCGPNSILLC